jgi:hypothetical protein
MTWLELYKFLNDNANSVDKIEDMSKFWNQNVLIYDLTNDNFYNCDTLIINDEKLVLSINSEDGNLSV